MSRSGATYENYRLPSGTYAPGEMDDIQNVLRSEMLRAKGGGIGTGGLGAVALRFDHHWDEFKGANFHDKLVYSNANPTGRGFPFGMAVMSVIATDAPGTTTADLITWFKEGGEVWNHGTNHQSPYPDGKLGLIREIVTAKQTIESWGFKVQGWILPGVSDALAYDGNMLTVASLDTYTGRLLRANYALAEGSIGGTRRSLPTGPAHGLDHITLETQTAAAITAVIDNCIAYKFGVELMIHSNLIGTSTYMTLADWTTILDYIKTKRDAGQLVVLTPSGLYYADSTKPRGPDLIANGDFEGITTGSSGKWTGMGTGMTLLADTPHGGSQYLHIPAANTVITQQFTNVGTMNYGGEVWQAECWMRAPAAAATGRIILTDLLDNTVLNRTVTITLGAGSAWTKFTFPFGIPLATTQLQVQIGRNGGDQIDVDDFHIYKV